MNTKAALGILAAVLILIIGFLLLRPAGSVSAPDTASSTPQTASTSTSMATSKQQPAVAQPTFTVGTTTKKTVVALANFDTGTLTSASAYPVLTGTASVPNVAVVVSTNEGVDIMGASKIAVQNGRWSYPCPVALKPGTYKVLLVGGDINLEGMLTVVAS